jgi:hypothetical protein
MHIIAWPLAVLAFVVFALLACLTFYTNRND